MFPKPMHCNMKMIFFVDLKRTYICVYYICAMFPFAYGNDISNGFSHSKIKRFKLFSYEPSMFVEKMTQIKHRT